MKETRISGTCYVCGDDLTVYQIIPEARWTMKQMDPESMGDWVFESVEEGAQGVAGAFRRKGCRIVVAGRNFGCGSKSVEHPMAALKGAGVQAVIAESVSRYSYRNAINLALPILVAPGIREKVTTGDELSVDVATGQIENRTTGETIEARGLSEFALGIIADGGLLNHVRKELVEEWQSTSGTGFIPK